MITRVEVISGPDGQTTIQEWPECSAQYDSDTRELVITDLECNVIHVYTGPEFELVFTVTMHMREKADDTGILDDPG